MLLTKKEKLASYNILQMSLMIKNIVFDADKVSIPFEQTV